MSFFPLKQFLGEWLKKKNFDKFLIESQVLSLTNHYLKNQKKIAPEHAKAISFKNGVLLIKCYHSTIASELYLSQEELKNILKQEFPEINIKKILFH